MLHLGEPSTALAERFHGGDLAAHEIDGHPLLTRWTRAARHGVRADSAAHPVGTSLSDLATRRARLDAVFREEAPLLSPMADQLAASGLVAVVADPEGVILLARGGGGFSGDAARVRLCEGARWSEQARGTNAIGTALTEQRPVAVVGRAHFEARNHGLFCYAAPIVDAYGDVVAALDVTGAAAQENAAVGLAVHAAAAALGRALRLRAYEGATAGGLGVIERLLARAAGPALLVEATGAVVLMNGAARAALGVGDEASLTAEKVFGTSPAGLVAAAGATRGGLRFETAGARYRLSIEPLHGPGGRVLSLLVYLDAVTMGPQAAPVAMGPLAAPNPGAPSSRPSSQPSSAPRVEAPLHPAFAPILGDDPALLAAKRMAARFASTPLPVLLLAETGTGKELFARAIHGAGPRARGAFVALNCGGIAPSLLESELFGHAPGAFTGALRGGAEGKIAAAHGGTLFLDEIAEMPDALQATLLRVLEDGTYYRVGEARGRRAEFRLISATCRDLPALVAAGRFRRDLFYRIHGAAVTLPPLRARTDRLLLARALLAELGAQPVELAPDAAAWVGAHSWPGNVRELKSALAHALVMAEGGVITRGCFPQLLLEEPAAGAGDAGARTREAIFKEAAVEALRAAGGNVSEAARRLGVARSTLYRMMR